MKKNKRNMSKENMNARFATTAIAVLGVVLSLAAQPAIAGSSGVRIFSDSQVVVDETLLISATGLDGLETVEFGSDDVNNVLLSTNGSDFASSAQAAVSSGSAIVYMKSPVPGTYSVVVGDGETSLASTSVAVLQTAPITPSGVQISVDPAMPTVGEEVQVTATGKAGIATSSFGLAEPGNAKLIATDSGSADVATATFVASEAGTYSIVIGDGETVFASVSVTVTSGAPAPSPDVTTASPSATVTSTPTATASVSPIHTTSRQPFPWLLGALAVALLAAVVVLSLLLSKKRRSGKPYKTDDPTSKSSRL